MADSSVSALPERISSTFRLKIDSSTLPDLDRGLFVCENVGTGNLVFTISSPFLHVANDSEKDEDGKIDMTNSNRMTTCDNCFATTTAPTVDKPVALSACHRCSALYYCSQDCFTAAFAHHHGAECDTLRKVANDPRAAARRWIESWHVRTMLRLLCALDREFLSEAERAELLAMRTNTNEEKGEKSKWEDQMVRLVRSFGLRQFDTELVRSVCRRIEDNNMTDCRPILRRCRATWRDAKTWVPAGLFVDPFAALINHDCEPNIYWYFDGPELHVRSLKDINSGEELFFSYIGVSGDYRARRRELSRYWKLDCTCSICQAGHQGPCAVGNQIKDWVNQVEESPTGLISSEIPRKLFQAILDSGHPISTSPMRLILQNLQRCYINEDDNSAALRTIIQLYYFCEPDCEPALYPWQRIDTLKTLIALLTYFSKDPEATEIQKKKLNYIIPDLRLKLIKDTEACFGAQSEVAKFEKRTNLGLASLNNGTWVDRRRFCLNLNWLLRGFELQALSNERIRHDMQWPQ